MVIKKHNWGHMTQSFQNTLTVKESTTQCNRFDILGIAHITALQALMQTVFYTRFLLQVYSAMAEEPVEDKHDAFI